MKYNFSNYWLTTLFALIQDTPQLGVKTLSGREISRDRLQSNEGWQNFTAGFFVGAESGVAWGYVLSQILPYYQ